MKLNHVEKFKEISRNELQCKQRFWQKEDFCEVEFPVGVKLKHFIIQRDAVMVRKIGYPRRAMTY
jgi:hypothetical protein